MKKLPFPGLALGLGLALLSLSGCFVNRHTVGDGPRGGAFEDKTVYSKAKQFYVLAGLVPLGRTHNLTPPSGNYQIKSSYNFVDMLINGLTLGFVNSRTVKVLVWPEEAIHRRPESPKPQSEGTAPNP